MSYTKTDMLSHKIIEILKEHSDEKHPLTQQQICGYLEEKLGIKPNRKTVAQHLKSIIGDESCNVFIADSENDDDKSDKKYITDIYYAADITAEEYEFLADSIIYSPMLPADYVRDLIKKINSLSTGNTKSKEANLRETFHYGNKSIFLTIENIKEAMNANRKLDVTISDYDKNGKLLTKSDPQSGIELHRLMLSPYGIVMADGFYYLLANDVRYDDLRHFRIDKILRASICEEDGSMRDVRTLSNVPRDFKPVQYKNLNRYMLNGTVERVHINIKKKDISLVLDTFGNEFTCNKVIDNDDIYDVTFRANIQTAVRWAIANRKAVKLTSPKRAVDIVKEEISALSEMYGNQER
ncbi:helix-turn-helix transcriptional regulator [Ruminococcus sp.]